MQKAKSVSITLIVLIFLCWIIFVGLGIEAGGLLTNAVFSIVNPGVVPRLYHTVDLSNLLNYDRHLFCTLVSVMFVVTAMKAVLFYIIIKVLQERKINLEQPFDSTSLTFVSRLCFMSALIGLFSIFGMGFINWLTEQGVKLPDTQHLQVAGYDVWLFMAVILFAIAYVFKKAVVMQSENELTI